jgi:sortase A
MKPRLMILVGFVLLTTGLANSFIGLRQSASPFNNPNGSSVDLPATSTIEFQTDIPSVPTSRPALTAQPASASPIAEPDQPIGLIPDRLVIPAIKVDAPIVPTKVKEIQYEGQTYYQWLAPNKPAVGWHDSSALLGVPGNTVLNGHHNEYGKVFKDLVTLQVGDLIEVHSGDQVFKYKVALNMLLPESFKSLSIRLDNARWILPTNDERLTLITCWPPLSNTYRVIVVALPTK